MQNFLQQLSNPEFGILYSLFPFCLDALSYKSASRHGQPLDHQKPTKAMRWPESMRGLAIIDFSGVSSGNPDLATLLGVCPLILKYEFFLLLYN
jgi:hypothetical protein